MNLLVTGATGFIGQAAIRAALREGHQVAALTRDQAKAPLDLRDSVRWLSGTLAQPPLGEIKAFKPAVCLHSAWIATPGVYLDSPENLALVEQSKEFARHLGQLGIQKFVSLGTCIEYAPSAEPMVEDRSPLAPQSLYARCKVDAHSALKAASQAHGFDLVWARIFYPYGPGEHHARLTSLMIQKMSTGGNVMLKTPNSIKDFIFIEDVASALVMLLSSNCTGTYNIGTGTGTSIGELGHALAATLGKGALIQIADQQDEDPYPVVIASTDKLRALGWVPKTSLAEGLQKLVHDRLGSIAKN